MENDGKHVVGTDSADLMDPVSAYNRLGPHYAQLADTRRPYLDAVDCVILSRLCSRDAEGRRSILDVGAGDGRRGLELAQKAGFRQLILLEPSVGMSAAAALQILPNLIVEHWKMRAEELAGDGEGGNGDHLEHTKFDAIVCLWNVLGHVHPEANRQRTLRGMAAALAPGGEIFLDVHHRYNAAAYGWLSTVGRWLLDRLHPGPTNGDVSARWQTPKGTVEAYGHVFTHREMLRLFSAAGLQVMETVVVAYDTGEIRERVWQGNLLYVLRRLPPPEDI